VPLAATDEPAASTPSRDDLASGPDGEGDPQLGQVALGDPAAVAVVDQAGDAVEQAGLGRGVEGAVAGVR
jgi:hypothetical protein